MVKTILLADDSSTIRRIVELSFSGGEVRVASASSGVEALAQLDRLQPELVLADIVMPAPDGYELCRRIKASEHPVPVVLLAGTFEHFDEERARACGADGYLLKPFEAEQLRDKVQALLQRPIGQPPEMPEPPAEAPVAPPQVEAEPPEEQQIHVDVREDEPASAPPGEAPSPQLVEAVARAVVEKLGGEALTEVAREVVPPLAAKIIRERIRELESEDS